MKKERREPPRPDLRDQLAQVRSDKNVQQWKLAELIGVKRPHISNIERHESDTTTRAAELWADECGYKIVLVPKDGADPEGLRGLIDQIEDPFARDVLAELARLCLDTGEGGGRYWRHFKEDFRWERQRWERDQRRREEEEATTASSSNKGA